MKKPQENAVLRAFRDDPQNPAGTKGSPTADSYMGGSDSAGNDGKPRRRTGGTVYGEAFGRKPPACRMAQIGTGDAGAGTILFTQQYKRIFTIPRRGQTLIYA